MQGRVPVFRSILGVERWKCIFAPSRVPQQQWTCVCVCVTVDSHATFAARRYTLVRDDPVSPHDWLAGKYVLYAASQRHFHGLEVYSDGAPILHNSCRRHEGITFAAAALSSLRVDARYKLVPISASAEDARGSDCLGGKFCDAAAADLGGYREAGTASALGCIPNF